MAFLGGKYLQPEQVIAGNVQTFRAREATTGRSVFVHRIAETTQPEQAALLRLLLSCLYRSSAVKELVLDVREEGDLCFVVTESVPQCLLLREWLQFESDRSDPGTRPAMRSGASVRDIPDAPRRAEPHPVVMRPPAPSTARPEAGEFTRLFQSSDPSKAETVSRMAPPVPAPVRPVTPIPPERGSSHNQPEPPEKPEAPTAAPEAPAPPGEFTRLFQTPPFPTRPAPVSPAGRNAAVSSEASSLDNCQASNPPVAQPLRAADTHSAPGEFTRLFQTSTPPPASAKQDLPADSAAPAAPHPKPEPGEFTRFFGGGSPARTPQDRSFPAVQRPLSLQNPGTPQEPGEFTKLFSGADQRLAAPSYTGSSTPLESFRQPYASASGGTAGEFTRIFGGGTERPSSPGATNSAGESTQLFGTGDPARAQPALTADPNLAPLNKEGPSMQPPSSITQGPSEFTRIVMGSARVEPVPAAPPPVAGAMPGIHAPAVPAVAHPVLPHPAVPHPAVPAAPHPAVPSAPVAAAQPGKKTNRALLLLFLILFVLAAALVIVIATTAKH
jgi:hypothetical protein